VDRICFRGLQAGGVVLGFLRRGKEMNYPESEAKVSLFDPETKTTISIVHVPGHSYRPEGHFCGYARFWRFGYTHNARPVVEPDYAGILIYVPVHGGITYAYEDENGMVYGFDCAHVDDEYNPLLREPKWLIAEAIRMTQAILLAAKYESAYLEASQEKRVEILQNYTDEAEKLTGTVFNPTNSLGIMLAFLSGQL